MRKRVLGFTLIELMIVVAIIAIIAAIAIPGLLRARISANEGSASAGLRSLASGQASFAKSCAVDQDGDGQGEYGTFNELTGQANRRKHKDVTATLAPLSIGDMSVAMAATLPSVLENTSFLASKSGYYYHLYLPGVVSDMLDDSPSYDWESLTEGPAIQQQENRWICYAWPATYKSSGLRAFVCDQSAEVYASSNTDEATNTAIWDGTITEPTYNSAMHKGTAVTEIVWSNIAVKDPTNAGFDGCNMTWVPSQ
jgi:prepilin-type N-terminal cleavage/methylation domain-containing protein